MIRPLVLLCCLPVAAMAQVSVNSGALDSLSPTAPATTAPAEPASGADAPAPVKRPVRRPAPARRTPVAAAKPAPAAAKPAAAKPAAPPALAAAPPPTPTIAPAIVAPPPAAVIPPPLIPVLADAAGVASAIPGGLRVTFAPDKADLNPATVAALHTLGQALAADPAASVNVFAYAAGTADDPSTPRRVSLSRALAARSVLLADGIGSTRIYVRALGNLASDGPADRVDVVKTGTAPVAASTLPYTPPPKAATPATPAAKP